jgi:hypothetical protein
MQVVDDNINCDIPCKIKKLVVFSGGNFTSGSLMLRRRKHIRGIILKCKIGPLTHCPSKLAIGEVLWKYTIIRSIKGNRKTRRVFFDKSEKLYKFVVLALIKFVIGMTILMIILFYFQRI